MNGWIVWKLHNPSHHIHAWEHIVSSHGLRPGLHDVDVIPDDAALDVLRRAVLRLERGANRREPPPQRRPRRRVRAQLLRGVVHRLRLHAQGVAAQVAFVRAKLVTGFARWVKGQAQGAKFVTGFSRWVKGKAQGMELGGFKLWVKWILNLYRAPPGARRACGSSARFPATRTRCSGTS
jgi:hypothetical protein